MQKERFRVLDGIRGVAAFAVMAYHYLSYSGMAIFKNTYVAVDLFFVLSGFVLAATYGDSLTASRISGVEYLLKRVARLFPVAFISILLGVPIFMYFGATGHSSYSTYDVLHSAIWNSMFLPFFNGGEIFSARGSASGVLFPSNPPLWSIHFEMLASLAFLILIRMQEKILWIICLGSGLLVYLAAYHLGGNGYLYTDSGWNGYNFVGGLFRISYGFILGLLIHRNLHWVVFAGSRLMLGRVACGFVGLFAAILVLFFPFRIGGYFYFIAIYFLIPGVLCFSVIGELPDGAVGGFLARLGALSFPIYCFHKPMLNLVEAMSLPKIAGLIFAFSLVIVLAYVVDRIMSSWLHWKIQCFLMTSFGLGARVS